MRGCDEYLPTLKQLGLKREDEETGSLEHNRKE